MVMPTHSPLRVIGLTAVVAFVTTMLLATPALAELSVTLDRNPVRTNETFTLDVKTDVVDADEPSLELPAGIAQLRRNTISSRSIVNGKISAERTWRYSLVARQSGEYIIPAIQVGAEQSAPIALTVLAPEAKSSAAIDNQPVVLRATVDQQEVYTQQQILLTVQMLRNVPMRFAQLNEPSLPTALVQKLGDDSEYETTINGSTYLVIERRYAIFPQQPGELVIPALRFQADISNERQLSMFGVFEETQPISLETQPITIKVKAPASAAPWLPAQQLSLTDTINPGPYRVGEPLTWTLTLTVDGLLPAQLPALAPDAGPHWRLYPDQPQDQVQITATGLRSTRSQKFALVPLQEGEQTLPPLSLSWWRLSDNTAQTTSLPPQQISVEATATLAPVSKPATQSATAPTTPISTPVTTTAAAESVVTSDATARYWPWLAAAFALLWLSTLALWWRQHRSSTPARMRNAVREPSLPDQPSTRDLLVACQQHNPQAARDLLLRLTGASHLLRLAEQHQGETAAAIEELNHALYGPPPQQWQGDRLAAVVPALARARTTAGSRTEASDLPPLYPR